MPPTGGSTTVKRAPWPKAVLTLISLSCYLTMLKPMARPRPVCPRPRALMVVKKGSKRWRSTSSVMPLAVVLETHAHPLGLAVQADGEPQHALALHGLGGVDHNVEENLSSLTRWP